MTLKQEHVLFFAFAILAIILLWDMKQKTGAVVETPLQDPIDPFASNIATPSNSADGPTYLTYNAPYAFAPPTSMLLPETTSGQIGQSMQFVNGCGGKC